MMTTWKLLGASALALAMTACAQPQDDFADATPDAAGLSLERFNWSRATRRESMT